MTKDMEVSKLNQIQSIARNVCKIHLSEHIGQLIDLRLVEDLSKSIGDSMKIVFEMREIDK